jgi:putative transposase
MVGPQEKGAAVTLITPQLSQNRACKLVGISRSVMRYEPKRCDEGLLKERIKKHAFERRRFGYRRIHYLLKREGVLINHKKVYRLYAEAGLKVARRGGRKKALRVRRPMMALVSVLSCPSKWVFPFVSASPETPTLLRVELPSGFCVFVG